MREIKNGGGVLQPVAKVWRRARSPNNEPSNSSNAISHMDDIGDGDAFVLMYNYEHRLPLLPAHGGGDGEHIGEECGGGRSLTALSHTVAPCSGVWQAGAGSKRGRGGRSRKFGSTRSKKQRRTWLRK